MALIGGGIDGFAELTLKALHQWEQTRADEFADRVPQRTAPHLMASGVVGPRLTLKAADVRQDKATRQLAGEAAREQRRVAISAHDGRAARAPAHAGVFHVPDARPDLVGCGIQKGDGPVMRRTEPADPAARRCLCAHCGRPAEAHTLPLQGCCYFCAVLLVRIQDLTAFVEDLLNEAASSEADSSPPNPETRH
jgi:hypothetical protein